MRPGSRSIRYWAARTIVVAALALAITAVLCGQASSPLGPGSARAQGVLSVAPGRSLSLLGEHSPLWIGEVDPRVLAGESPRVVVRLEGPAAPAEVGRLDAVLPLVKETTIELSELGTDVQSPGSAGHLLPQTSAGRLLGPLPEWGEDSVTRPGAYRVRVAIVAEGVTVAAGGAWLGKVAPTPEPLALAFVWPVALGVHRDCDGVYVDGELERALARTSSGADQVSAETVPGREGQPLEALLGLSERFPGWRHTLALEPVLLAQLRDMADGYLRRDDTGAVEEVSKEAQTSRAAAAALVRLAEMAAGDEVGILAMPYATPDLPALADEGWTDGFEQLQLGKRELQETLGLGSPPAGFYLSGARLNSACLSQLAEASVDHILVDGAAVSYVAEPVSQGSPAIRVRNEEQERVTLVLARQGLRSAAGPPWEAAVFLARLAAELASGPAASMVVAPSLEYGLPPQDFLDAIGRQLTASPWLTTLTVADLLRRYPPATRPLVLRADNFDDAAGRGGAAGPEGAAQGTGAYGSKDASGYIRDSLQEAVRSAHGAIAKLAVLAEPTSPSLDRARRLTLVAESRWWYRPGVTAEQATIGLRYALRAEAIAREELEKVTITGVEPALIWGQEGELRVAIENRTAYRACAGLRIMGPGLQVESGTEQTVALEPGPNSVALRVSADRAAVEIRAELLAGGQVLEETRVAVRFVRFADLWPWVAAGVAVLGGAGVIFAMVRRRSRPQSR